MKPKCYQLLLAVVIADTALLIVLALSQQLKVGSNQMAISVKAVFTIVDVVKQQFSVGKLHHQLVELP